MREPTREEMWYLEDQFSSYFGAENVEIELMVELNDTEATCEVSYDIMEGDEVVDSMIVKGLLWLDIVEDCVHLSIDGRSVG